VQRIEHTFKAMGGPCRFRLEVSDSFDPASALQAAEAEVRRLESKYSRYTDDSLTTQINRAAGSGSATPIDAETAALLNYANTLWRESDGLFDLTSGVLRAAWDFKSGRLPEQSDLAPLLSLVGWSDIVFDESSVYLPRPGMEIDFGGCVKEYAADSAAAVLGTNGVTVALVDLAGDMAAVGAPGGKLGWPVGIRHPAKATEAIAQLVLPPGALASSGDYERCITIDGVRYGHILNPRTGWPVQGLVAVSVLAPQCLVAGSSATIAMLREANEALAWLEALGLPWFAVDAKMNCYGTLAPDTGASDTD